MPCMKRLILFLPIVTLFSFISEAQILKGKITSQSGEAIPYATVYIQELRQGTTANTKGDYEIKLPLGKYLVIYQSLGFSPVFYNISVTDQTITKDVALPVQFYEIPEVRITASGEDPAYSIMRYAIGMAPYYLNNVNSYKAEVYIKGNLVINRIPRIFQKAINAEVRNDNGTSVSSKKIKAGDVFLMESFNEIEFTAPDKYSQKVISINSTFPETGNNVSPMDIIEASFYEPLLGNIAISPLSPQAFSYYRFKYQGASLQGNYTINKIQVIPKMKSQQLFEGTIYIIEGLWCLHSVDLTNNNIAGKIRIQQLYIPVQDDIWMPVSHKFEINLGIMGFRADAGYGSSVKYLEVKPNLSLKKPDLITADYSGRVTSAQAVREAQVSNNQEKINKILEKDELSNRDMITLSRLMNKESDNAKPDSVKNNLEIKDNTTQIVEKDATKKDSTYWAEIRPIPLSDVEIRSIRIRDSIKNESLLKEVSSDTLRHAEQKKKSTFLKSVKEIGTGHTWRDTTGISLNFGGLVNLKNFSFNTVDGFIYGFDFRISKKWKNNNTLTIAPDLNWAFSREALMWSVHTSYNFDRMKQKQIYLRTGILSKDISTGGSINILLNSIASLFFKQNYLKLYETRYITAGYKSEIRNGLILELSAGFDGRRVLENNTNFSFVGSRKSYSDNMPDNQYLDILQNPNYALRDQNHFEFVTNVTFTPQQKYRIYNNAKINEGSDWPTFSFMWKHGINEFSELSDKYKSFDMFRFEASKNHKLGGFSELRWKAGTGGFLNNTYVPFYDFFHFNSQPLPVLINEYQFATRLPAYYSLSTPEFYGEAHIKYTTPYLLLKYLPVLSKTLMRENLSFSYLGSRHNYNYTEFGYSISELFFLGELGIYAGFEDLRYKDFGVRLVLKLN
jgi:hypothetical protein